MRYLEAQLAKSSNPIEIFIGVIVGLFVVSILYCISKKQNEFIKNVFFSFVILSIIIPPFVLQAIMNEERRLWFVVIIITIIVITAYKLAGIYKKQKGISKLKRIQKGKKKSVS